jgi:hypothetical protein
LLHQSLHAFSRLVQAADWRIRVAKNCFMQQLFPHAVKCSVLMHCVCLQAAKSVLSQLKRLARAIWSNPPTHGARIAAEVVGDADMFELWKSEVRHPAF